MHPVKIKPAEMAEEEKPPSARSDNTGYLLAHFSDPHLSSLEGVRPLRLANKRLLGYLSWRRNRRRIHDPVILKALLRDLAATAPDHIVVTGDLTHLGLPDEFQQAAHWLAEIGVPEKVTVVPGNHDTYVPVPWQDTFAAWSPYLAGDADPPGHYPFLRVRGPAALIGLCSARPSWPFLAVGSLGREQLGRLEEVLAETGRRGLLRVLLLHHPPVSGSIAWRKRLNDAGPLSDILRRQGAELILHGHAHFAMNRTILAEGRQIPVLGVPSISDSRSHPQRTARYHLFRLIKKPEGWLVEIIVRGYSVAAERFIVTGRSEFLVPTAGR